MRHLAFSSFLRATLLVSVTCVAQTPPSGVRGGQLPQKWITGGPNCMEVPDWQIQQYNETCLFSASRAVPITRNLSSISSSGPSERCSRILDQVQPKPARPFRASSRAG